MNADTSAHCRKGIAFSDDIHRLFVVALSNGSHVVGHIDTCRTCMLASGYDHGVAGRTGTAMFEYVVLIFFGKKLQRRKGRLGTSPGPGRRVKLQ